MVDSEEIISQIQALDEVPHMDYQEIYDFDYANINEEIDRLRHSATSALLLREDVIVVSSVSCIYGLGSPKEYKNKIIPIIQGKEFDLDDLIGQLVKQQYIRNDLVVTRGSFRLKGDTLDIFPVYPFQAFLHHLTLFSTIFKIKDL